MQILIPNQSIQLYLSSASLLRNACVYGNHDLVLAFVKHGVSLANNSVLESLILENESTYGMDEKLHIIKTLLDRGMKTENSSHKKMSILDMAMLYNPLANAKIVDLLRSKGAKTYQELREEHLN